MTIFVLSAALLVLVAVAFATAPLWRQSRGLAMALAVILPLGVVGLYQLQGTPAALDPANLRAPQNIDEAIAMLQARLEREPDNVEGWILLARSHAAQENYGLAARAYARAHALAPDDADLGVEYAEAMMRNAGAQGAPAEAVVLLEAALRANPNNQRALLLSGMQRMQAGKPAEASALWERLLPMLEPAAAGALRAQIDMARVAAQLPPMSPMADSKPLLTIEVGIAPDLAAQARPGDVLFVFARSPEGGGPPFAVKRIALDALPMRVTLGDDDSPMPAAKLSAQKTVQVVARLSRSGNAQAGSGDIEAEPLTVDLADAAPINLTLSRPVP
ncbi:tetratricopeptide repeat protein [Arenimonas sp.]|uniref:tetratricopeptide repeat protein n=1 Tax=Arenimonas sp. TaxID=1872635 RepID=UPI0039E42555